MEKKLLLTISVSQRKCKFLTLLSLSLFAIVFSASAQTKVSGVVTDANGNGIEAASVQVKGTSQGTTTDATGHYSIIAPGPDAVLVFSFSGYGTFEQRVGARTSFNVTLVPTISKLDEVVVVGYGTQSKKDLTGAVSTVSSKEFERVPAANPLQAIQGRVSGLSITTNSGLPGAGSSVLIRGVQSINGTNSPIFVVDGLITSNIDNINPNDIASVSVLKDASATAIYGARAANGVIIIDTKSGKGKTTPEITFNAYAGVQGQSNLRLHLLNSDQFLEIYTEAFNNGGVTVPWTQDDLNYYKNSNGSLVSTDWLDLMTRPGYIQSYNVGLSGGSDKSNYNVSAGYFTNRGMVIGTDYKKFTFHLNSDYRIANWIHFGSALNLYSSTTNGSGDPYRVAATKVPLTRAYEDNGDYGKIHNTALEHQYANPIWQALETHRNAVRRGLLGNIYLTMDLLKGLEFTARGNLEWGSTYRSNFSPGVDPSYGWEGSNLNFVSKQNEQNIHWITDYLLHYKRSFGQDHSLDALLGYSVEENTYENLFASRSNTPNNSIRYLDAGDPTTQLNENGTNDWAFLSMFGRINYAFRQKYLLTASLRRDGTSRLANGNPWGLFPSAAIAWRISREDFMSGISFINDLKVRASWGKVGNVLSVGQYATIPTLSQWNYVLGGVPVQGYTAATSVNQDLKWESTDKADIGIDATVLNSRIYATLEYFVENTNDLLFQQQIPASTGYSNDPYINAGQVRNTGYEAELGYRNNGHIWNFDFGVNFSHVKNRVIDLEGRDLHTQGLVEGYPVDSYFGYKSNGLIYTQNDLSGYPHLKGKQLGDIWLVDVDEDGKITSADRTLIGKRYPSLTYGAMATVGYRNLTLQVQLQGIQGVDKSILGEYFGVFHYFTRWAMNADASIMDRYSTQKNPNGKWPRVSVSDDGHNREFSDFWLRDASFMRIKNVNLNYNFSQNLLGSFVKNLGVYISVENLYTFTNFPGTEVDTNDDPLTGIPQPRTFTLGIRATF
jgi:TonB-linked SusC/RagA family outer membrane protein